MTVPKPPPPPRRKRPAPYNPLAPGIVPLTPQQKTYVNQQVTASLSPERQAILSAQKAAQEAALQQQQRIIGFSKAAAEMLTSQVPQTSAAYHQAIQDQAGLAQGFTQGFRDSLANVPGSNAGPASDALYALGGNIPASSLNTNALANLQLAQSQPATQLGLGQQGLRSSAYDTAQQNKQYLDQLVQLAQKAPGIRAQIVQALQQNELQKRAERANEFALGIRQQQANASITQGNQRLKQEAAYQAASIKARNRSIEVQIAKNQAAIDKAAAAGLRPNATLSGKYGYIVDANGNAILDASGKKIPVKHYSTKNSAASATTVNDLRATIADEAKYLVSKTKNPRDQQLGTLAAALINNIGALKAGKKLGLTQRQVKQLVRSIVLTNIHAAKSGGGGVDLNFGP